MNQRAYRRVEITCGLFELLISAMYAALGDTLMAEIWAGIAGMMFGATLINYDSERKQLAWERRRREARGD